MCWFPLSALLLLPLLLLLLLAVNDGFSLRELQPADLADVLFKS